MGRKATEKQKAQMKAYNVANRDKIKAQRAAHYQAHKEAIKLRVRAYYHANKEKIAAYHASRKDKRREYNIKYNASRERSYGERDALYCERRYARKRGLPDTLTLEQWQAIKAAYQYRCAYCRRKVKLEQDHVIPLTKGGGTTPDNIVPSCRSCNSKKNNNLPEIPVKVLLL